MPINDSHTSSGTTFSEYAKPSLRQSWDNLALERQIRILHSLLKNFDIKRSSPTTELLRGVGVLAKDVPNYQQGVTPASLKRQEWVRQRHGELSRAMFAEEPPLAGALLIKYFLDVQPEFFHQIIATIEEQGWDVPAVDACTAATAAIRNIVPQDILPLYLATLYHYDERLFVGEASLWDIYGEHQNNDRNSHLAVMMNKWGYKSASKAVSNEQLPLNQLTQTIKMDSANFTKLRIALDKAVDRLLTRDAAEATEQPEDFIYQLREEANKMNIALLDLLEKSGNVGMVWSGLQEWNTVWDEAESSLRNAAGRIFVQKRLLVELADWLPRQTPSGRTSAMREDHRQLFLRAAEELRNAASKNIGVEFPGQHNVTPDAWWYWQLSDEKLCEEVVAKLRIPWCMEQFATVVAQDLVVFSKPNNLETKLAVSHAVDHFSAMPQEILSSISAKHSGLRWSENSAAASVSSQVEAPSETTGLVENTQTPPAGEPEVTILASEVTLPKMEEEAVQPKLESNMPGDDNSPDGISILTEFEEDAVRVHRITKTLLEKRRDGELYWLMRTVPSPEIPVWLVELLYLGTRLQPGFTTSQSRIKVLLSHAHDGDFSEELCMLLAASLIRPVLMIPALSNNFRSLLDKLIEPLASYHCGPLLQRLIAFACKGRSLDDVVFKELSLISQGQKYRDELERRTHAILVTTSVKKTSFQRATAVVKELFCPRGELGKVLHACLNGDFSHIASCLKKDWEDKNFLSKIVNELDERLNKPHKGAKKIDYKAFVAIARDAATAKQLLTEWDRWQKQDGNQPNDFSHQEINTIAEQAHPESLPNSPYASFLKVQLEELRSKFDTSIARDSAVDPWEELAVWPIILEQAEFSSEGFCVPPKHLLQYLEDMSNEDVSEQVLLSNSLHSHIHGGRFFAVRRYLDIFPQHETDALIALWADRQSWWSNKLNELIEEVQLEIWDAYLRGVIQESLENDLLRKIQEYENRMQQDKIDAHQAVNGLEEIRNKLHNEEEYHKNALQARLNEVKENINMESVQHIKALIDSGECAQAYDAIAGNTNSDLYSTSSDVEDFFNMLRDNEIPPLSSQKEMNEITAWNNLTKSEQCNIKDSVQLGRITELLRWLGFSLEHNVAPEQIYRAHRPVNWNVAQYEMTINCPIPQWGSRAGGRHIIIMGWKPQHDYLQLLLKTLFEEKAQYVDINKPITILWFGSLAYEHRIQLIQQCARNKYLPVVIDYNLFRWLHLHETSERRTKALFNVALAGSSHNPYTPDTAGAVPREMFVGRKQDIEALWDPFGPCVVYGGRQLGKSALLNQVQKLYHAKDRGQYVLLYSMKKTDSSLIDVALQEMRRENILEDRTSRTTFFSNAKEFFNKEPNRRILFLFDECDDILEQDAKASFPDLKELRDLMTQTARRFKIVLTGLHSVQRFSRIPNSPLPHFGAPLCVGPLQPEAASELVQRPMECLGLKFEPSTLVNKILTNTNRHPSLIQLFCEEMVKSTNSPKMIQQTSKLPILIDGDLISQVYKNAELRKKIRQRFDWTLVLDERYRAIGYTLALLELTATPSKAGSALLEEFRNVWPAAFQNMGQDEMESLLEEMVGLGILAPVGSTFRLCSPNIIHLLGGEENIVNVLAGYHDLSYTSSAELFKNGHIELLNKRPDPLVVAQRNTITARQAGLILVVGTRALGLDRVCETMQDIMKRAGEGKRGRKSLSVVMFRGTNPPEIKRIFHDQNKKHLEGGLILWTDTREIPDPVEALHTIQDWQRTLHTDKKFVKIVCLIDAKDFLDLRTQLNAEELINSTATQILFLHRWTKAGLNDWYTETDKIPKEHLDAVLKKTGGWDACVMAYLDEKEFPDLASPGYALPDTRAVAALVNYLHEYGEDYTLSVEDLHELMQNETHLDMLLETLTRLGILIRSHDDLLSLEPYLTARLKGSTSA